MLGEWTVTATHRQDRTFFPPPGYCPLCPTQPGGFPTEVAHQYDLVVFENKFPSFQREPPQPAVDHTFISPVRPAQGVCEVVVYTPEHSSSLAQQPVSQIYKLMQVWQDRFLELDALSFVEYVFIFENKGEAVGVTLPHPHGQIYAYPFVPPKMAKKAELAREFRRQNGRNLMAAVLDEELRDGRRIVARNSSFTACIPFFARYPYELHIYPNSHASSIGELSKKQLWDLAKMFKRVLVGFDMLFGVSFPYIMSMNNRPSDGEDYFFFDFHIEFYPPMRTATKLKFLAGSEAGAGLFINDTLPEEKAAELRGNIIQAFGDDKG
jgi:UDPglucose--hexose-1-phosphate uridylyltransferase